MNRPSTGWVGAVKLSVAFCAGSDSWGIVVVPVDDSNRESIAFDEYWVARTRCCWKCVPFRHHHTPALVELYTA